MPKANLNASCGKAGMMYPAGTRLILSEDFALLAGYPACLQEQRAAAAEAPGGACSVGSASRCR